VHTENALAADRYNHRAKRQLNAFFDYDTWQVLARELTRNIWVV
jgi:hypothetical protein